MSLQDMFTNGVSAMVRSSLGSQNCITVGELAALLDAHGDKPVLNVGRGCSYRGYYEHFALGIGGSMTARGLAEHLRSDVIGKTFQGYKGGDFTMRRDTFVFHADYGCCGKMVTGITVRPDSIHIETQEEQSQ